MIPELAGVLSGGLDGLLHPARARRELARQLRVAVLEELAGPINMEQRHRWAQVLRCDWWPVLEASREPGEDTGWSELFASVALTQALLLGERPAWIDASLQGRPAYAIWHGLLQLHRRCILLLSERVRVCPIFAAGEVAGRSHESVERATIWRHDGPSLRGRSHTLMLSLLRDGVLDGRSQAIAATGEVLEDGASVGAVRGLVEKATAWWREEPDGLLISGPLGPMGAKGWGALTRADWRPYDRRGEPLPWIAGSTLVEIRSKLRHIDTAIRAWDGRPIDDSGLVDVRLSWHHRSQAPDDGFNDALKAGSWAAARGEGPTGVLILGAPGCGKSILSRQLERRFQRGWLGSLGFGVRRAARELGAALLKQPDASWPELLAVNEPERLELFEELDRTRRLVPIVDGLDELDRHQLALVCARLRAARGWWMATGRPLHAVQRVIPPAWVLQIDELRADQAKHLLEGLGRPRLASQLFPSSSSYRKRDGHVGELTKTPFHLSLLARSVQDEEDVEGLSDSVLYSRAFKGLLDQARNDDRLGDEDVRLLERMLSSVIGELAIQWLRSPTGFLGAHTVELALEEAGVGLVEQASVIRALEFGYLLAPANEDWEFSHRTLAEWAAARALSRRVKRRLRATQSALGRDVSRAERAALEAEVFAPFVTDEGLLPATGPWAQLLRFACDGVVEPLAFLRRIVGPESQNLWQVLEQPRHAFMEPPPDPVRREAHDHEVLEAWNFAAELGRRMRWGISEDARIWWGICVRRWLLMSDRSPPHHRRQRTRLAFHVDVVRSLPHRLSELVELAAHTPSQRSRLRDTPEELLPAIPPERAGAVRDLLQVGRRQVQLQALRWFEANSVEVRWSGLDALIPILPMEIETAEAVAAAEWERVKDLPWDHPDRATRNHHDDIRLLKELETLIWELTLRDAGDLPWDSVRERLLNGPSHLVGVSAQWMGTRSHTALSERGARQRRDVLAQAAKRVAEQQELLRTGLEYYRGVSYGAKLVKAALSYFKNQEESTHRATLGSAVDELGWELGYDRFYHHNKSNQLREVLDELKAAVRLLSSRRHRLERLATSLAGEAVHSVGGALWAGLPLGSEVRDALGAVLVGLKVVPRQLPASAVLGSTSVSRYGAYRRDERTWQEPHLQELRSIATTGQGETRFRAIVVLARHEGVDERLPLLEALPTADADLIEKIRFHLGHDLPIELVTPEVVAHLPLHIQANVDAPGWRLALLAELAAQEDTYATGGMAKLAAEHGVRDAVPLLVQALRAKYARGRPYFSYGSDDVLVAACELLDEDDPHGRELVQYALVHGWPGEPRVSLAGEDDDGPSAEERAGRFLGKQLTVEDLELLGNSEITAADRESLRDGIRELGSGGLTVLERVLQRVAAESSQLRQESERVKSARQSGGTGRFEVTQSSWEQNREYERRLQHLEKVRGALVQTIIAVIDEQTAPLGEVVDLCFRLVGGDVHHVYSTPGPLGSDFDEPGDLDWHSEQKNAGEVAGMAEKLNGALDRAPDTWPELRRLFPHPSESLRKAAFQRAMVEAPPTMHVELAIEALAGHASSNRTSWTGQKAGLMLSGGPGMGSSYVESPDTARTLVEAVRHGLTPAHRSVVQWLAEHELAPMRALACRWASELGDAEWVSLLRPLLAEPQPEVFAAAQRALGLLSPATWEDEILAADRSQWTEGHDQVLFRDVFRDRDETYAFFGSEPRRKSPQPTATGLSILVAEAVVRLPADRGDRGRGSDIAQGYPSLLDRALEGWFQLEAEENELEALLLRCLKHPRPSVRASARQVLVMDLELDALRRLLEDGEPLDRASAALCLVLKDSSVDYAQIEAVLEAARSFASHRGSDVLGVLEPAPDTEPRWRRYDGLGDSEAITRRLLDVLATAGLPWFRLFGMALRDIHWDDEGNCWQGIAERTVRLSAQRARALGEDGLIALLQLHDGRHYEHVWEHEKLITENLSQMPRLRQEVSRRLPEASAERTHSHTAAERIWEDWSKSECNPERPLVLDLLREHVFPADW